MGEHLAEDDLLDLAQARRPLGEVPAHEAHLADCAACSALLRALIAQPSGDEPARDLAGRTLGPYRLDTLIGRGGMGEVYRAWDLRLRRHVAVKVLPRRAADDPARVQRLEAEGRAAAAIAHPNVVTVYDTGTDDGVPFVVSELITGESLRSVLARGPIARATAIELALQLARGVAAAHAQGVVHRDLKPENLIVTGDGVLKILDFGLARVSRDDSADTTDPGTLLGTAGYLAPEQARGEPGDARSDLFAIGALMYELLSGQRAFGGDTFADRLLAVLRDSPPALDDAAGAIIARCLEKEPRQRFQSADDLAWALDRLGRGATAAPPPPARRGGAVSRRRFVAGVAATGLGGLWLGRRLAPSSSPRHFHPVFRQLSFRQGRVASARFTPDGGSLLYTGAWDGEPPEIYSARLGGGGTRSLDLAPAQLLAVSARGQLALCLDPHHVEGFHHEGELALAPLEGGRPRGLGYDVQWADFTPDGSELLVVRSHHGRFRLESPPGAVLFEAGWLSHPRFSPDGRQIACLAHDRAGDNAGDVVLVPRAGGGRRTISAGWSSIDGLAWAPDGRALWISASERGGNTTVRAIGLDGRERVPVPSAGRLRVNDVGPGGLMAVSQVTGRLRLMVHASTASGEVDLALSDVSLVTAISADGASILFAEFGDVDTANGVYLRPTRGGPAQHLGGGRPMDLASDGRGVLVLHREQPPVVAVVPVTAGQARRLALPGLAVVRAVRWGAGDRLVVEGAAAGRPPRLWRLDGDRDLTPLTGEGVTGLGAVSPDGRVVASIDGDHLRLVDVEAPGPPRLVPGSFTNQRVCGWLAGGAEVLVRRGSRRVTVDGVEVVTGTTHPILSIDPPGLGMRGIYALVVSPDGRAYAYSYAQELSRLHTMTTPDPGS